MNVFAKFDEIPSMILKVIKETKRYGHTVGRSDDVKTVYPPTNTVCGGIIIALLCTACDSWTDRFHTLAMSIDCTSHDVR